MKRSLSLFFKGMGMGAADAVPGVSGGTIAFVTGIYEELIHTIRRFGPEAFGVWRRGGMRALIAHLNLVFLIPLVLGIGTSVLSVAHLVTWLMASYPLLLNAFFFGLVLASAGVVFRRLGHWQPAHLLPLLLGGVLAWALPMLLPTSQSATMLFFGGAIAISAMLLPGVSGSFLLLTMGLYGTVMGAIKGFEIGTLGLFAAGCLVGLFTFSRVLSWLFRHHHDLTLNLLIGFILGSLPTLWPWQQLTRYRMGDNGDIVPLHHQLLWPNDFSAITGEPAHLLGAMVLMIIGVAVIMLVGERSSSQPSQAGEKGMLSKESGDNE
ncbi:DUF368 domain-containing protein [Kushneria phosphatilytica]|uniref:DUF368 domain-containing protein n=1 Tax=Kushneria phosphatilytica TaxID=657387 RepID=A0A1S1NX72_9GAMM|nr:DUF368 domain-containing protein [Kushneria phosphatilytica]OHV10603.1 DUF368 domain-containing protein [Kushneria phosphatilytica]QEL11816.1 DUF368 domain-containing protein [Kushneria phosphatilytica]